MTSTKDNLMNSLMSGCGGEGEKEQDLFGDAPDDSSPNGVVPENSPSTNGFPLPAAAHVEPTGVPVDGMVLPHPPAETALPGGTENPSASTPASTPAETPAVGSPAPPAVGVQAAPVQAAPSDVPPMKSSTLLSASGLLGATPSANGSGGAGGGLFDDIDEEEEQKRRGEEQRLQEQQRLQVEEQKARAQEEAAAELLRQQQAEADRARQLQEQMQSIHLGPPPPNNYGGHPNNNQGTYPNVQSYPNQQMLQGCPNPQMQQQGSFMNQSSQQAYPNQVCQQQPQFGSQPPQQHGNVAPQQMNHPTQMNQQQPPHVSSPTALQPQQIIDPPVKRVTNDFYRDHTPPVPVQQQQSRYYQPVQQGFATAGMHGVQSHPTFPQPQAPPPQPVIYNKVSVSEPLLLQSAPALFGIGQPPHWSYQIMTELQGGVWMVRRRFRHVVALEERLRDDCPGAILPPRPDKHATRAIEEASAHQSAEFAMQRANELQSYLNNLVRHPVAMHSVVLRLFLALQDDLGTAWPEVSSNALTRLANAGVGAAVKVSEQTSAKLPWQHHEVGGMDEFGEDNAELLALQNAESVRMGAVLQAVPKLEGTVTLLREYAEQSLSTGMELGRLAKDVELTDRELGQPIEIMSAGMLRAGRRSKRLSMEIAASMQCYSHQYKICKYERLAFADRRAAIQRRSKERSKADHRAAQVLMHQRQQQHLAASHMMHDRMAQDAALSDTVAVDANQEAEEIGQRLKQEVNRVAWNRKVEWNGSVKVIASSMKEAVSERVAIWETVRENFLQSFPEYGSLPGPGQVPDLTGSVVKTQNVQTSTMVPPGEVIAPTAPGNY